MQLYLKRGVLFISLVASALAALPVQAQSSEEYYQQSLRNNEQEQQLYQYNQRIYEEQKRAQNEANQQATNQRAFREQEARNQAIRNADYWGAIAIDNKLDFGTYFNAPNPSLATSQALASCAKNNNIDCMLILKFKNTCGAFASPLNSKKYITATDRNPNIALSKAWNKCETTYGVGHCMGSPKAVCSGFPDNGKSYQELGF